MVEVIRAFCWHQQFVPKGFSALAPGLYTCIKSLKMCLKSHFKEIVLKLATKGQSDKGFLLTSTFVSKGLSAPVLGLYRCIKALKYIPGPGVRWAFTGPLFRWFIVCIQLYCCPITYEPGHEKMCLMSCEQQRRRSACASAQSDQRICCSLLR